MTSNTTPAQLALAGPVLAALKRQAQEVLSRPVTRLLRGVHLPHWHALLADSLRSAFTQEWQRGMVRTVQLLRGQGARVNIPFAGPAVQTEVERRLAEMAGEVTATSEVYVTRALEELAQAARQRKDQTESYQAYRQTVRAKIASPARALTIAVTELARARHGGELQAASLSGVVAGKRWEVGPRCCERCRQLAGRLFRLDAPFVVLPGGGPYAVVMHPPLHPSCQCKASFAVDVQRPRPHRINWHDYDEQTTRPRPKLTHR